jgi:hypothetical protein
VALRDAIKLLVYDDMALLNEFFIDDAEMNRFLAVSTSLLCLITKSNVVSLICMLTLTSTKHPLRMKDTRVNLKHVKVKMGGGCFFHLFIARKGY